MLNLSITFSFVDLKKLNTDSATSNNFRNECLEKPVKNIVTVLMKTAGKKVSCYFWV